jgi:hypothetical protein
MEITYLIVISNSLHLIRKTIRSMDPRTFHTKSHGSLYVPLWPRAINYILGLESDILKNPYVLLLLPSLQKISGGRAGYPSSYTQISYIPLHTSIWNIRSRLLDDRVSVLISGTSSEHNNLCQ